MDSMPTLKKQTTRLLNRTEAINVIVEEADGQDCFVSGLGYISRDLHILTQYKREKCFYCMGSMGSVAPLALGISLALTNLRIFAIEGDGSLLMNLGTLATLNRYGSNKIRLVVIDNGCYESTGGQLSQSENFHLENMCRAAGLPTEVATSLEQVKQFVHISDNNSDKPLCLVIKVAKTPSNSRISDKPEVISQRFSEWLSKYSS